MGILDRLEKRIQQLIEAQFGQEASREPLELRGAILNEIEEKVHAVHGKRVFPYNHLVVHLLAEDADTRAVYEVAFVETENLETDIRKLLDELGCEIPDDLQVSVPITDKPSKGLSGMRQAGFYIQCTRRAPKAKKKSESKPRAHLTVVRGRAEQKDCPVNIPQTNLGRLSEVVGRDGRIIRRNDLAFLDIEDEVNSTVSRAHAHIYFDEKSQEFRVSDDGSAHGTQVVRGGRSIEVPTGVRRGVKVWSGDEIRLGKACVRFEIKGA